MSYESFKDKYAIQANEQQEAAIKKVNGPTALLAVPGSGKTTVIVSRTGYMIYEQGIDPESILTITFTVASANEMKERFIKKFNYDGAMPHFSTINSLCVSIINLCRRKHGIHVPQLVPDNTTIIRDILIGMLPEYPEDPLVRQYATSIGCIKNNGISVDACTEYFANIDDKTLPDLFVAYQRHLDDCHCMDFDDQMILAEKYLTEYPDVLDSLQEKYRYISVDEAQDTSVIQHKIIQMLGTKYQNVFMVGDEDQCWAEGSFVCVKNEFDESVKRVEDLAVGDLVESFKYGLITDFYPITNITKKDAVPVYEIETQAHILKVTSEHKLFIKMRRKKVPRWAIEVTMNYCRDKHRVCMEKGGSRIEKLFDQYKDAYLFARGLAKEYCSVVIENLQYKNAWYYIVPANQVRKGMITLETGPNSRLVVAQIMAVRLGEKKVPVYNIEVAETGNLIVDGVLSHNCIYEFRGAYPQALLDFDKTYPSSTPLFMETNYRSSDVIVSAANQFIKQNQNRYDKNMKAHSAGGAKITEKRLERLEGQYRYVYSLIKSLQPNETFAVLARDNASLVPLIDLLDRNGIRVNCRDSVNGFINSFVVQDCIELLKLAQDDRDFETYKKMYYKLGLFLPKTHLAKLDELLEQYPQESLFDLLDKHLISTGGQQNLRKLKTQLKTASFKDPRSAIELLTKKTKYLDYFKQKTASDKDEIGGWTYCAFLTICREYKSISDLLEGMHRIANTKHYRTGANVTLTTMHSSKGLEFDTVVIINAIDGILPSATATDKNNKEKDGLYEGDVRLFYVAATRAKKKLVFISANVWEGETIKPSRFISALIPKQDIAVGISWKGLSSPKKQIAPRKEKEPEASVQTGDVINHKVLGRGIVTRKEDDIITINFNGTVKRFSLNFLVNSRLLT